MMHNYVVANQFSDALLFTASSSSYQSGSRITLTVSANGTQFVKAKMGVYLAISVSSACTLNGDHGDLEGLSSDLVTNAGCSSLIYSNTGTGAFNGSSSAMWIPGSGTSGDVTFKLVWSNGPGSSDKLSMAGAVRVPDSYMYMKTITISGPSGAICPPAPTPSPPAPGRDMQCVISAGNCPMAGVDAPVFVQTLNDEGEATFPAGRCIPCRVDQRGICRSAQVSCPKKPGEMLEERIWTLSKSCEGEPQRIAYLPSSFARCPSPEHYSPTRLDLERFVPKLQRDHPHHVKDEATARAAIEEYRKMLYLIQRFPEIPVVPSKLVDLVWHEHILDTVRYKRDCLRMFGNYIHHNPSFGGEEEKQELVEQQMSMFRLYQATFDAAPPSGVWPTARKQTARMPDCCSALCVKPACHNCVGCNSVDCGKFQGEEAEVYLKKGTASRMLSPDAFAGYVPTASPNLVPPSPPSSPYACSIKPFANMKFDWTVCDQEVHFRHTLEGISAWYGVGLTGKEPFDMGFGDYMISMMNTNYTGVKDLYKYDAGQGYPCWDVLHECSADNQTMGSKDVENDHIERVSGATTSTWSRKLETGDAKDWPIKKGNMTVLFAHGREDYFTYHAHRATCTVDFFSGMTDCGTVSLSRGAESTFV